MRAKRMLVVESSDVMLTLYRQTASQAGRPVTMIEATSVALAHQLYEEREADFDLILVCGSPGGYDPRQPRPETYPLVEWFRDQEYAGRLIAASSLDEDNAQLITAGCDEAWSKFDATTWLAAELRKA